MMTPATVTDSEVSSCLATRLQPIVDLRGDIPVGFEMLSQLAWFADIEAYFANLGDEQLLALIRSQIRQANGYGEGRPWRFFVNIRSTLLQDVHFVDWLCRHAKVPLALELDPTELQEVVAEPRPDLLTRLRRAGHQLWLDDFDECTAPPGLLSWLDWDGIKIDKAVLWRQRRPGTGLSRLVERCQRYSPRILVEGVESTHQLQQCRLSGLDLGQGFYWPEHRLPR